MNIPLYKGKMDIGKAFLPCVLMPTALRMTKPKRPFPDWFTNIKNISFSAEFNLGRGVCQSSRRELLLKQCFTLDGALLISSYSQITLGTSTCMGHCGVKMCSKNIFIQPRHKNFQRHFPDIVAFVILLSALKSCSGESGRLLPIRLIGLANVFHRYMLSWHQVSIYWMDPSVPKQHLQGNREETFLFSYSLDKLQN